ncbi:alanyl-tRNA synthetase [Streptococcus pneumoniae]|nr:alanyl-tRNA synthetase [Streptococcus pneumoniae]CJC44407.1 alanyl-tRNA synthetase [Streptococcus pneumoniae]CJI83577.1 alanyl-tRNA synthetase [Streptococcus pneumoniae]CJJ89714.1 alanyl-tRNA synthetase [Streptococcus pneumoniae]CKF40362.1 alanyl-tRNA synthetase [Streptococcus pneumoniae]
MNDQVGLLKEAAGKMKTNPKDILTRVDGLFAEVKQLQKENESLAAKLSNIEAGNLTDSVMTVDGVNVLAAKVNVADMNNLRTMMDDLKNKLESAVVVLASVNDDKVNILAGVTKDLISQGYHAGKLVKEVASRCGGGGGGRPDMAQAGGKNPAQVEEALAFVQEYVKSVSK